MQIKTITTVAGVNEIDFGNDDSQTTAHFYWFKNLSDSTLYVSAMPNPVAGEDNVAELSAKGAASVETDEGKVYVLGAGKVEIHRTNSKFCPFELPSTGSGGGGGGSITVDSELSETSENPLQNKATTAAINEVKSELDTKSDVNHIHDIIASGNPVTLANLQGEVPFSEIAVSGKNLLTYPYNETTKTINGITFTDNGDGTITANGTATGMAVFALKKVVLNQGKYTLSGCPAGGSGTTYAMQFAKNDWSFGFVDYGNGSTKQVDETVNLAQARIIIYSGTVCDNLVFRPQLELGSTPTAYEPPITGRELTVNVSGKNLLQKMTDKTIGGLHYSPNDDGSVSVTGTQTAENYPGITSTSGMLLKAGNYTLSGGTERLQITALDIDANTVIARAKIAPATFSIDTDKYIRIYVYSAGTYNGQTFDDVIYPQLELGDTATEYEPYHGSTTTITPTSNPYIIPNDIRQQDGLNNISVSAGELSVVGVQRNAAVKRIWDNMGMDLLFDGVIAADNPALIDIKGYSNIVVSVASKYSDDIINTGTIIMAVSDIIKSISVGIKRYFSTGSRASIINITGTINNCAIVLEPYNTGDTILNCKIYGIK